VSGVCGCGEGSFRIFRMAVSGLLSKYGGSLYKSFSVNSAQVKTNPFFPIPVHYFIQLSEKESSFLLNTGLDKSREKNTHMDPWYF
jgi:hypothetical protein